MARGPSLRQLAKAQDQRAEATWPSVRRLLGYLAPFRATLAAAVGWVVVSSAATAATPWLTGRLVDVALSARAARSTRALVPALVALLAVTVVGWLAQRQQIMALGEVGQRALVRVHMDVFEKVQRLSVAFFDRIESGDLMSRLVNDVETLNSFLGQGFRRVIGAFVALVATLAAMLLRDWRLALATLTVVPLLLITTRVFSLIARRAFRRTRETVGDVSASLAEELGGVRVAQAFDRTDRNLAAFSARNAANRDANITATAVSSAFQPALGVVAAMLTAIVALAGGWLVTRDLITIGGVVAFIAYARTFFTTLSQLSSLYAETQSAIAGGERIFGLLDVPEEVTDLPDARELPPIEGCVEYRDVSFRYGEGPEVLHAISLVVEPGSTVAVVGETGAGKTTLANLLARFYDPTAGTVLVDGHDLRHVRLASLHAQTGIVLQEPFLFAGTVAENVRYGRPDATDAEVIAALDAVGASELVERLPQGLETLVGERGGTLSTGQRQLVALARAVIADPRILILDEATSSVDTRTEALIRSALARLLPGRTALVIAHRLSTVRDADRILVVDAGRIVEDGTYAELLSAGGAFARLHAAQFAE